MSRHKSPSWRRFRRAWNSGSKGLRNRRRTPYWSDARCLATRGMATRAVRSERRATVRTVARRMLMSQPNGGAAPSHGVDESVRYAFDVSVGHLRVQRKDQGVVLTPLRVRQLPRHEAVRLLTMRAHDAPPGGDALV